MYGKVFTRRFISFRSESPHMFRITEGVSGGNRHSWGGEQTYYYETPTNGDQRSSLTMSLLTMSSKRSSLSIRCRTMLEKREELCTAHWRIVDENTR